MEEFIMQHLDLNRIENNAVRRVWSVTDFAKRHRLDNVEEARLLQLFGPYASACELQHNVKQSPRYK